MTGNEIRAARALIGMEQIELAEKSGASVNTIRNMEAFGSEAMRVRLDTIAKVRAALEAAGVEFIPKNGGGAGVRLKK